MAIKNIFARGIGFTAGVVSWVVTRGFGSGFTPPSAVETSALYGTVTIGPALTGTVTMAPALVGTVTVAPALTGTVTIGPALTGSLTFQPG